MPYRFAEIRQPSSFYIALPTVSSERREYIPMAYLNSDTIASNQVFIIPNAPSWVLGVVTSRMHMVWVRAVAGRLKTDYRYSAELCYNTFPFPDITDKQKKKCMSIISWLKEKSILIKPWLNYMTRIKCLKV